MSAIAEHVGQIRWATCAHGCVESLLHDSTKRDQQVRVTCAINLTFEFELHVLGLDRRQDRNIQDLNCDGDFRPFVTWVEYGLEYSPDWPTTEKS